MYLFVLQVEDGVSLADELVNNDSKPCLLQKSSTKKNFKGPSVRLKQMKRRQELEEEKQFLEKGLKEFE